MIELADRLEPGWPQSAATRQVAGAVGMGWPDLLAAARLACHDESGVRAAA